MTDAGSSKHFFAIVFAAVVAVVAIGMFLGVIRQAGGSQSNPPQASATASQEEPSGLPWG
jgi:hypothetical protein